MRLLRGDNQAAALTDKQNGNGGVEVGPDHSQVRLNSLDPSAGESIAIEVVENEEDEEGGEEGEVDLKADAGVRR
jgi:hypothetical protein